MPRKKIISEPTPMNQLHLLCQKNVTGFSGFQD